MGILTKIRKLILLTIFSIIFSTIALTQAGSALTLTPTKAFYAIFNTSQYNEDDLQINYDGGGELKVSFLQFDISGLKDQIITSSTLNLYTHEGAGTSSLYYVFDNQNSWVTSPSGTFNQTLLNTLIGSSPTALVSSVDSSSVGWHAYSSSALATQLQDSVDLTGNNLFSLAVREDAGGGQTYFRESGVNGPTFDVSSYPCPIPEPSSILLSLIGLSGVLGSRRKKFADY